MFVMYRKSPPIELGDDRIILNGVWKRMSVTVDKVIQRFRRTHPLYQPTITAVIMDITFKSGVHGQQVSRHAVPLTDDLTFDNIFELDNFRLGRFNMQGHKVYPMHGFQKVVEWLHKPESLVLFHDFNLSDSQITIKADVKIVQPHGIYDVPAEDRDTNHIVKISFSAPLQYTPIYRSLLVDPLMTVADIASYLPFNPESRRPPVRVLSHNDAYDFDTFGAEEVRKIVDFDEFVRDRSNPSRMVYEFTVEENIVDDDDDDVNHMTVEQLTQSMVREVREGRMTRERWERIGDRLHQLQFNSTTN